MIMERIPIKLTITLPAEVEFDIAALLSAIGNVPKEVESPKEVVKAPVKEVVKAPVKEVARLMKAPQVAKMTGLSPFTIYEYAQRGILPCIRMGRRVYFDREQTEKWIKGLTVKYAIQ